MAEDNRLSTGVPGLDAMLGGGLIPGTLTVVCGATGIGKTQLGVQFAVGQVSNLSKANSEQVENLSYDRGILFDMSSRGDSQSHAEYARRMFDWRLSPVDPDATVDLEHFFDPARQHGDYLHVFRYHGRRVTRRDLDWDDWNQWQAELNSRLRSAIAFFYG
ncbi:MAG TPA: ATPase domain-containing protein, partial [Pirellulaceae bacterium]|nr:ATPase domain-containing protein [Pirellulaceae bacterium]